MGTAMVRRLMLWLVVASVFALVAAPLAGMVGQVGVASAQDVVTTTEEATAASDDTGDETTEDDETSTGDDTGTGTPTEDPTEEPTGEPTEDPTEEPTEEPTAAPTEVPTDTPATPEPSVTEEPITIATTLDQIVVTTYCFNRNPEMTKVVNTGDSPVTVLGIRSVYDGVENALYAAGQSLSAEGGARVYRSGPGATSGTILTTDWLFDTTAADVRVRVETSIGTVEASCGTNPNAVVTLPSDIKISLDCTGNPERTRIDNFGDAGITIISIETLVDRTAEEPIVVNRSLGAGRTVIYRSGSGATSGTILTTTFIYTNTAYENEGVRVTTDIGVIEQRCAAKPVVTYPSELEVTLSCGTAPEWAKVINVGQGPVTLTRLTSLYQPTAAEPFSLNKTLQPGQGIIYRSGDGSGANFLTRNYIYNQDAGSAEGVRVTVSTGKTFTTRCPDAKKWIEVNLSTQVLTAWQGNTVVATSYVATGKPGFETPTGVFYINSKPGTVRMAGCSGGECWDVPDVPAAMAFTYVGHYIHGAYWHNNFGTARTSHGCVNLPVDFSWWIFNWTPMWTEVRIHY